MLRLTCPTGCAGFVQRPYPLRARPVRCANCRAWFAAPARVEDSSLSEGVLVAMPGACPPATLAPGPVRFAWVRGTRAACVAAVLTAIAGLVVLAGLALR